MAVGTEWGSTYLAVVVGVFKGVASLCFDLVCSSEESCFFQCLLITQPKLNSKVKTSEPRCKSYLYG